MELADLVPAILLPEGDEAAAHPASAIHEAPSSVSKAVDLGHRARKKSVDAHRRRGATRRAIYPPDPSTPEQIRFEHLTFDMQVCLLRSCFLIMFCVIFVYVEKNIEAHSSNRRIKEEEKKMTFLRDKTC